MEKFNGVAEKYFNSGQLKSRATYKNGKLEGLFEIWDRDSQLESREPYKEGVKQ